MFQTSQKTDQQKKQTNTSPSKVTKLDSAQMMKGHEIASKLGAPEVKSDNSKSSDLTNDVSSTSQSEQKIEGDESISDGGINWKSVKKEAKLVKDILVKAIDGEELTNQDKHVLIFSVAEICYELSKASKSWIEDNPRKVALINMLVIDPLRVLSSTQIETNPDLATWNDLILMFVLELGNETATITDINSPTLVELRNHEGVVNAREKAIVIGAELAPGESKRIVERWDYKYEDMIDNLREMKEAAKTMDQDKINMLTLFLGTYAITVDIRKLEKGMIEKQFTVKNTSGLESLTRFRREASKGGGNQGILENKQRGEEGYNLGGNLNEIWQWTE